MRQPHVAGEKLFVDFAGRTAELVDGLTGEIISVQIFVQTVSDNLKTGITKACFHERMINRTYADMARHYGTAIVPARPYKPRDKAKVEVGVQVVGRWILARLRHHCFFSLAELSAAIRALLDELNDRPMRGWGMSRRALFQQLDKPALRSLPPLAYEYAEWKRRRVSLDYHVEIAKHYYSMPHQLLRQEVEARITVATIEIFHRGKRVASHRRSLRPHRPTTVPEHMPSAHRRYRDWTHERIRHEAQAVGPDAAVLVVSSCARGLIPSSTGESVANPIS